MESFYTEGYRDKEAFYYYSTGVISHKGKYTNGHKVGLWEYFNPTGITDTIINYE